MRFLYGSFVFGACAVVGGVQAEIETGQIDPDFEEVDLLGVPLGLYFLGWHHGGVNYTDLDWNNQSYAMDAQFVGSPEGSNALGFGALVSPGLDRSSGLQWGTSDTSYGEHYKDFIGEVGEFFFLGFTFVDDPDADDVIWHFGFIQILKLTETQYDWIGYAYETEDNTAIEVFNLVPAPSGVAVLGLAALGVTRRRRV